MKWYARRKPVVQLGWVTKRLNRLMLVTNPGYNVRLDVGVSRRHDWEISWRTGPEFPWHMRSRVKAPGLYWGRLSVTNSGAPSERWYPDPEVEAGRARALAAYKRKRAA